MSGDFKSLYEDTEKDQIKRSIPVKSDYSYKLADGHVETVDLTRVGIDGLCCPEIVDLPGVAVLKGCKLQPIYEDSKHGMRVGYVSCGPLGYVNNWERCPVKRRRVE